MNIYHSDDEDSEQVKRLERFMLDRGYWRHPEHGFWISPTDEERLAIRYAEQGED